MVLFVTPTKEDQFLGTDWLLWDVLCSQTHTGEDDVCGVPALFTLGTSLEPLQKGLFSLEIPQ